MTATTSLSCESSSESTAWLAASPASPHPVKAIRATGSSRIGLCSHSRLAMATSYTRRGITGCSRTEAPEPQGVHHDGDRRRRHGGGRDHRVEVPEGSQRDRRYVVGEGPEEVLADHPQSAAGQVDGGGHQ